MQHKHKTYQNANWSDLFWCLWDCTVATLLQTGIVVQGYQLPHFVSKPFPGHLGFATWSCKHNTCVFIIKYYNKPFKRAPSSMEAITRHISLWYDMTSHIPATTIFFELLVASLLSLHNFKWGVANIFQQGMQDCIKFIGYNFQSKTSSCYTKISISCLMAAVNPHTITTSDDNSHMYIN